MFDFLMNYGIIVNEVCRLLKVNFMYDDKYKLRNPISDSLEKILYFHNKGDYLQRDIGLMMINFFVKHLKEIENYDKNLLSLFRREIKKQLKANSYSLFYGLRFEVNIAASIIRKGIRFEKSEAPDFYLYYRDGIFIECGSCHLDNMKFGDLRYKILTTIKSKSKKAYCNSKTALFIDVTNITHWSIEGDKITQLMNTYNLFDIPEAFQNERNYGGIVLFCYNYNREMNRIESNYSRIDNQEMDSSLALFLDEYFPKGGDIRAYNPYFEG